MILHSELSRRRIRSIKKLIRVNKLEVVSVLRVDKDKGAARWGCLVCLLGLSGRGCDWLHENLGLTHHTTTLYDRLHRPLEAARLA